MTSSLKDGFKKTDIGFIPQDWDVFQLGTISTISRLAGAEYTAMWKEDPNGEIIALRGFNIDANSINDKSQVRISNALSNRLKRSRLNKGDVVYPCVGSIGNAAVIREDNKYHIQQNIARICPDFQKLDPDYLSAYLMSFYGASEVARHTSSSSQPSVLVGSLRQFRVPVPPTIKIQRSIAKVLAEADNLSSQLEKTIAKKRDIRLAARQKLLTGQRRLPGFSGDWEVKCLSEIAELVMGQSPSSAHYNTRGNGLPLIQGNADIKNRKTIRRIFTTEITKQGKAGDILLTVRAPVGEVSKATFDVCLGRGVCAIRGASDFLFHYLISIESSWARLSKGSTFDSISSVELRSLELRLPPSKEEQTAIAEVLSDMDAELVALEVRRAKISQLKQGMMQELLTGRIRLSESP